MLDSNFFITDACYESNLVSIFSAPAYESTMNYLEQVADAVQRGTHRYTMVEGTSFQAYVQDSTEGVFSRLQPFLDPRILVTSNEEGIQAVLSSKNLVFLAYEEQLDFNNRQFGSPLYKAPDRFLFRLIAIPIAKGAAYKPYFDRVIQNIVSGGLVQKWLKESCGSGQNCTSSDDELKDEAGQSSPEAFTLEQMQGAFYILGLGLGLAFLAFLIERLK
ncbi:unnamed protein product [Cyprideis torosa]|uniref:Uncharacterized protein n=1 Tax=Cyprideis torosa TaxID=163714 RepID=A0A7R8WCC2_9CRUS|nr:unnamed protein product [Cyprideis torosa]CAG0893268.1 unnamed protein product [Cyprideis torosa]